MSLNPVRETLEDYFVQQVRAAKRAAGIAMRTISLIAVAVFRESVRDRVPYAMVVFAMLLMAASYLIAQMTAGQDMKIIKDLGLAALSIFGLFIAVFIGIGLVSKEVEKKSVFGMLSKPVSRTQFVLGKYAGLVMTLAVNLGVMTIAYYAVLYYMYLNSSPAARAGWPAPAMDPAAADRDRPDLRGADAGHRAGIVLFDVFEPAAGDAAHDRLVGRRSLQRRPAEFRDRGRLRGCRRLRARSLLRAAESRAVRRQGRSGLRHAGRHAHVLYTVAYAIVYIATLLVAAVAIFRRRDFK